MRKGLESEFYYFYILGNYITVNTKLYHYYSMISKGPKIRNYHPIHD